MHTKCTIFGVQISVYSVQVFYIKAFEQIVAAFFSCYFIYVIIVRVHEKHIAREVYLESPQRYMMELFCETANEFKPLAVFAKKNFIINV